MALQRLKQSARFGLALALLLSATGLVDSSTPQVETLERVAPGERGVSFKRYAIREVPWSVNVIRIDRKRPEFELTTTLGGGTRQGLRPITEQIRRIPTGVGRPVAAINGDFYQTEGDEYSGDPRGLQIANGELVSSPNDRVSFWVDTNGEPRMEVVKPQFSVAWPKGDRTPFEVNEQRSRTAVLYTGAIGRSTRTSGGTEFVLEKAAEKKWLPLRAGEKYPARIREIRQGGNTRMEKDTLVLSFARVAAGSGPAEAAVGDVVWISTESTPSLKGVQTAIGGGPELVRGGKAQPARVNKSTSRHPRSALGWNDKEYLFVTVDGRQPRLSNGMTLP